MSYTHFSYSELNTFFPKELFDIIVKYLPICYVSYNSNGTIFKTSVWGFDGIQYYYYGNGKIAYKIPYKHGLRNGTEVRYFRTGAIRHTCEYVNGSKHGKYISYFITGNVQHHLTFKRGKKHGEQISHIHERPWYIWKKSIYEYYYDSRKLRDREEYKRLSNILF